MRLLNVGCGSRYANHPSWTNVDQWSSSKDVIVADLRTGIPFADSTFDGVYHSHLLEHFSRSEARIFMKECLRVLKSGGIVRASVPDLEYLARRYLHTVDTAECGTVMAAHEWATMELIDQMVRDRPGGEQLAFLRGDDVQRSVAMMGGDLEIVRLTKSAEARDSGTSAVERSQDSNGLLAFLSSMLRPGKRREAVVRAVLGRRYHALTCGEFRLSGEVHQWLYDRVSLAMLLKACGFTNPELRSATVSGIPDWTVYCLDTERDGTIYKPSSLIMEAQRPSE